MSNMKQGIDEIVITIARADGLQISENALRISENIKFLAYLLYKEISPEIFSKDGLSLLNTFLNSSKIPRDPPILSGMLNFKKKKKIKGR